MLSYHVLLTESSLCGTKKAVKVTRPSTSAVGEPRTCSKVRNRDGDSAGSDDDEALFKVRCLSAEPDSIETCKLSFSGRFCRNSVQAREDWKFFRSSSVRQTSFRTGRSENIQSLSYADDTHQ